jgi:ATP-dependent Clp protease ATP-binding subunit ClpA
MYRFLPIEEQLTMKIPILGFTATRRAISIALLASFVFTNAFAVDAVRRDTKLSVPVSAATANYTTDLTELGRNGSLRQDLRFEAETAQLIKMLAEGGVRQPVIIDQDKDVLNTVVEQAALRIAKGNVPAGLKIARSLRSTSPTCFRTPVTRHPPPRPSPPSSTTRSPRTAG